VVVDDDDRDGRADSRRDTLFGFADLGPQQRLPLG
jgi:hypothetical protein